MKILIADDHAILRKGIRQLLTAGFPGAEITEAENGNQVVNLVNEHAFNLLILDISMPGANGLDVLRELKDFAPDLPVLVLSMHPEDEFGTVVMKAGARGYLSKESGPEELLKAAEIALSGGRYMSDSLTRKLQAPENEDEKKTGGEALLSQRESAVMRLLVEGHPVKEIGARLDLNPKTVSTYRHRVLTKLGVSSNAELVQYVLKHQLV